MTEKKIDRVLYIILSIVVLGFLYFNVLSGAFTFKTSNNKDAQGDDMQCSCGGTERTMDETGMLVDVDAMYEKSGGSPEIQSKPDDSPETQPLSDESPEIQSKSDQDPEAQSVKEETGSISFEDESEDKEHKISPTGYYLLVDLDHMLMHVYKDGEPVKTFEVSGGKPNSPSPVGTWRIISKDTWGEGFGGAWMGFNVPWGKYGIHGTSDPWSIGRSNASKGCIRMHNSDARELYRMLPYNTPVTIVYDNIPFYPMRDGDVGSDVQAVERALKKLDYYQGSDDGVFGSSLKAAVMKFQKDNKLYSTGVVNSSTYEKIMQLEKGYDEQQKQLKQEQERERKRLEQELE